MDLVRRYPRSALAAGLVSTASAFGRSAPYAAGQIGRYLYDKFKGKASLPTMKRSRTSSKSARARTGGYAGVQARAAKNELNFLDSNLGVTTAKNVMQIFLLNGMPTGNDANTRLGRKIHIKSIQLKGTVSWDIQTPVATGGASSGRAKVCLVYDKQSNGAAPAFIDIFDNSTTVPSPGPWTMRNISNADRFVILHDEVFDMTVNNDTGAAFVFNTDRSLATFDYYRKCNLEVTYNTTAGSTVGSIATGGLFLIFVIDDTAASDLLPSASLDGFARIRFDPN